jgi:hypothetical protein
MSNSPINPDSSETPAASPQPFDKFNQIFFIYFAAMLDGYLSGKKPDNYPGMPHSKCYTFSRDRFTVLDCFFTNNYGRYSDGMVRMWYENQPIWSMWYGGWYQKEALGFLKEVMRETFTAQKFYGGRGPEMVRGQNGLVYVNKVSPTDDLLHVQGAEQIWDKSGALAGMHEYHCMLLVPRSRYML